jgi:TetR/AcrR family transcriptional regulator of autoinduction and epiphytic fitness
MMLSMEGDVKGSPPRSRNERAAATRRTVVDAAYRLFCDGGYAATTMELIASSAGVAVQTVYYVFRTKAQLLQEVVEVAAAGEHDPVPVIERPWMREAMASPDAHRALAVSIEHGVDIYARVAPLNPALAVAAAADPQVAAFRARIAGTRRRGMSAMVSGFSERRQLRSGVTVERATDVMFVVISHETYLGLTHDAGWSLPEYKAWLFQTISQQLLAVPIWRDDATRDLSFHDLVGHPLAASS